jgi:hypothetical protein
MTFQITAKFFFDNGQVKKVDWLEHNLVKKKNVEGVDVATPLTLEEAEKEIRLLFLRYMNDGKVLSVPNILGELSIIPFSKLYYATASVKEYSGEQEVVEDKPLLSNVKNIDYSNMLGGEPDE